MLYTRELALLRCDMFARRRRFGTCLRRKDHSLPCQLSQHLHAYVRPIAGQQHIRLRQPTLHRSASVLTSRRKRCCIISIARRLTTGLWPSTHVHQSCVLVCADGFARWHKKLTTLTVTTPRQGSMQLLPLRTTQEQKSLHQWWCTHSEHLRLQPLCRPADCSYTRTRLIPANP